MNVLFLFFLSMMHLGHAVTKTSLDEESRILSEGLIDDPQYIASGILGTVPGFGIGHAIQGRWKDKGWIFTAGETFGLGLMMAAGASCMRREMDNDDHNCSGGNMALAIPGMITFFGFKVWEIVDVWTYPPAHNRRYKELESKKESTQSGFFLVPILNYHTSGLTLQMNF